MSHYLWNFVVVPLMIMVARIVDVSIGTVRIIFVSRGKANIAAILGFFEVLIWLLAISQVFSNLGHFMSYIGYAAGFALGNIIGINIEKKLAVGVQIVRIIKRNTLDTLQMALRDQGFGVTTVHGRGGKGEIDIVYVVAKRKDIPLVMETIRRIEPDSFVTVQDIYTYKKGFLKRVKHGRSLIK